MNEIKKITKKDGIKYSVRIDRRRYFFPDEWTKFINSFKNKQHKFLFLTLIHTGGRIMEVLNLKYEDIDTERGTIMFKTVKQRTAKRTFSSSSKTRNFFVASNYLTEYKSFIRNRTIKPSNYIFLDNEKLPNDYENLKNSEKKKYYASKVVSYSNMLKNRLKKIGISDWRSFSLHNIRKTYGMWMRTFNIEMGEMCYRLGHDMDTFISHYGSSLIFSDSERRKIQKIMGDVK